MYVYYSTSFFLIYKTVIHAVICSFLHQHLPSCLLSTHPSDFTPLSCLQGGFFFSSLPINSCFYCTLVACDHKCTCLHSSAIGHCLPAGWGGLYGLGPCSWLCSLSYQLHQHSTCSLSVCEQMNDTYRNFLELSFFLCLTFLFLQVLDELIENLYYRFQPAHV